MRVLVTGGTGYLGRHIVARLVARGHVPVVFARRATESGLPGILVNGDVRDRSAIDRASEGCEAGCHAAALVSVWRRRRADFDEVNVGGLEHMLDVAKRRGFSRLVYTSSFLALPPAGNVAPVALNDYQRTKVAADLVARRAADDGVAIVCTYPGVIYGPGALTEGNLVGTLVASHLSGRLPGLVGWDRLWSFAEVGEVAGAHVAAVERGRIGARYHLGGENVPVMRAFEIVGDLTGRSLPRRLPAWAARSVGWVELAWAGLTGDPPQVTPGTVGILTRDWPLDSSVAIAELGYRVPPLAEGLARMVAALPPDLFAGPRRTPSNGF